jgi:4-amino-4-deoxy-L-arabinose transferase-like glycosyltransferase
MLTKQHNLGLLFLLALYLVVSISYGLLNPLAEAPDEIAHMELIRFIGLEGHLPQDYGERAEAGYKSDTPMLYHLLQGKLVGWVGPEPYPRLKVNSLSPQRLLVFDGLSPFTLIHTWDERFPFQGIVLSWHLARLVSTLLGVVTLLAVYHAGLELFPNNRTLALAATATAAALPQFHFQASNINDDNLLALLTSIYTLWLIKAWKAPHRWQVYGWAGLWLGLAVTTKYSPVLLALSLPLLLILAVGGRRLVWRQALTRLCVFALAAALASAWWFLFVEWHFNEIATLGLWVGLLKPLMAGRSADVTLLRTAAFLTGGTLGAGTLAHPSLQDWGIWLVELFRSFWQVSSPKETVSKTILSTIFLGLTFMAGWAIVRAYADEKRRELLGDSRLQPAITLLFLVQIVLLLPMPMLRFWITRNVPETAQGRHILMLALPATAFLLTWGGWRLLPAARRQMLIWILPVFLLLVSLVGFFAIRLPSFPPPLPVRTTPLDRSIASQPAIEVFQSALELVSIDVGQIDEGGALPVTLTWHSLEVVQQDYLVGLWLTDEEGQAAAYWLGHPVDGRYPTRVWQPGDVIQDTLWLPIVGLMAGTYPLYLNLCPVDTTAECFQSERVSPLASVTIPMATEAPPGIQLTLPDQSSVSLLTWQQGRSRLAPEPFTFRAAIPVTILESSGQHVEDVSVELVDPNGTIRQPLWAGAGNAIFMVGADWSSGPYQLRAGRSAGDGASSQPVLTVSVHPRQFDLPPISQPVYANFGDEMELLGYDFSTRRAHPGDRLPITLYWRARKAMQNHYILFNHLLALEDLQQWGGGDRVPQDYYSTILWAPGEVVVDSYTVPVSRKAPPGVYRLDVGAYLEMDATTVSLPLIANGEALDQSAVTVATIKVGGPPPGAVIDDPQPEHIRNDNLSDLVTLIGYDLQQAPTTLTVTLYWRCDAPPPADYTTFVHLRNQNGDVVAQMDRPPAAGAYPTSLWDPGETIRDRVVVPLPAEMKSGDYQLVVGLYDPTTGQRLIQSRPSTVEGQQGGSEILLQEVSIHP